MISEEPKQVLIIDDDPFVGELLQMRLGGQGYKLTIVHSAEEGLQADMKIQPDLILLDVKLPEMSGFQACEKLMEAHGDKFVPIILVTSMDAVDSKIRGLECGAHDYVTKPFDPQELLARVQSALRTKKLYDELVATREKLTEAEKLAALGQMAIMLHHEINNPLQAIVLSAESILADLKTGEVSREDVETILTSSSRIEKVMGQITKLKRIRSARYIGDTDMLNLDESS